MDAVDLVCRNHERCFVIAQDLKRLDRLRAKPLVDIHHDDRHIGERPPARTEGGEGMVPGGVDEEEARDVDADLAQSAAHPGYRVDGDERGADVLRDRALLGRDHGRAPDPVEERRLAVVHVTHHADDGSPDR